jgi:hypothetical protein
MSSIIKNGQTFRGISVFGRGVFTNDFGNVTTYAGQHRGGYACGLGVATHSNGSKEYAEHGPEGKCDGYCLVRFAIGITGYGLYECGKQKKYVFAFAEGGSTYNGENCEPDDPRVLALIAQVAPVEVRPAAPAPHPPLVPKQSSDGSAGSFSCSPRRRSPPPWPPRCTPMPRAIASGRATQGNNSRTAKHDHAVTRARTDLT